MRTNVHNGQRLKASVKRASTEGAARIICGPHWQRQELGLTPSEAAGWTNTNGRGWLSSRSDCILI